MNPRFSDLPDYMTVAELELIFEEFLKDYTNYNYKIESA